MNVFSSTEFKLVGLALILKYVQESKLMIWQYRLWSFTLENTKLDRLLHLCKLIQRIFLYLLK